MLKGWQWRRRLGVWVMAAIMTAGLIIVPHQSQAQTPINAKPIQELRGVWLTNIDSDILFSRDRLKKGLKRLDKLNFNTVYPTVWNWGYTLYPSEVAARVIGERQRLYPDFDHTGKPDAREVEIGDRDMLQELIDIAKDRNLHVLPWFEFGFMAPADSALVRLHPEWLTRKRDGNTIQNEGRHPRVWLNPFHPEVQAFLIDMIREVVAKYDIDGIQLDDHFGLPVDYGYDTYTVKLYQQEHKGKRPPKNPNDPEWIRWRANKITGVMAELFQAVKAQKQQVILSLSPNPAEFAYNNFLQDWVAWEQRGYVGELVLQVYRSDRNRFLMELERPEVNRARKHIPVSIGVLSGLKQRDVPMNWIRQQVQWVRDRKFAGVSFFFFETLFNSATEQTELRTDGFKTLFTQPAQRPSTLTGWTTAKE